MAYYSGHPKKSNNCLISESQGVTSEVFERHIFASGLKVFISKGDLIHQKTEAIVCPANSLLKCTRGAAKIIANAAGRSLIEECEKYIREKQYLPITKVMHTTAGNLKSNIKYVIHAAGPNALKLATDQTSDRLHPLMVETFLNCFNYTNDKLCLPSIAVPAISAGNNDVPIEIVGSAMFEAVDIFDKERKNKTLKEIHFVNIDETTVENICMAFKNWSKGSDVDRKSADRYERHSINSNIRESNINVHCKTKGTSNGHSSPKNSISNDKERDNKKILAKVDLTSLGNHSDVENAAASRSSLEKTRGNLKGEFGYGKPVTSRHSVSSYLENDKDIQMEVVDDLARYRRNPENELKVVPSNHRKRCDASDASASTSKSKEKVEKDVCAICMDKITHPKKLKCGHVFCKGCLKEYKKRCNPKCPTCGMIYGEMRGDQPPGTWNVTEIKSSLPGYERCGTLRISYDIADGVQDEMHPNPGTPFRGTHRIAYLPDNEEGREVAELLTRAFDNKMLFTIGRSHTTGRDDVIIYNDIHLKTATCGTYGYPDLGYLKRVKEELAAKGIQPQEQDE